MSNHRSREVDHKGIEQGAKEIASMLDNGQADDARARLLSDLFPLMGGGFKELVQQVNKYDNKDKGWNIHFVDPGTTARNEVFLQKPAQDSTGKIATKLQNLLPCLEIHFGMQNEKSIGVIDERGFASDVLGSANHIQSDVDKNGVRWVNAMSGKSESKEEIAQAKWIEREQTKFPEVRSLYTHLKSSD